MADQTGIRLYFAEAQMFSLPGLILFPRKAGIFHSTVLVTGMIWRKRTASCFEIRALGLGVKKGSGIITLFLKHHDGEHTLCTFPKQSIVGITDLEDQDIVPAAEERPRNRPIEEILRDSQRPTATPAFLPHSHDV